ncbi:hypothetical protein [Vibrio cholerae]|uniref:hypothetical protein n=1 Tax=Vibrio cholerae TaxID=666 RepID=UPI003080E0E3
MKKLLLLPVLMLSFNAFAYVSKDDLNAMRKEVKGMTKEAVTAKHIKLYEAVKADASEKNCYDFNVFADAALNEKKIDFMDMEAQKRSFSVRKACIAFRCISSD